MRQKTEGEEVHSRITEMHAYGNNCYAYTVYMYVFPKTITSNSQWVLLPLNEAQFPGGQSTHAAYNACGGMSGSYGEERGRKEGGEGAGGR